MCKHDDMADKVIVALRRVIRAVDLHSRTLVASHGLTGLQALILCNSLILLKVSFLKLSNFSLSTGSRLTDQLG